MQTLSIAGYKLKNRKGLKHWEPLLEEWLLMNERYCRVMDGGDAPFLYGERALVGILAGAAWRCGRISLEEFQYEKGYVNKPKWLGRADLYMASEDSEELVEAKFRSRSLNSKDLAFVAEEALKEACTDAGKTRGREDGITAIGITFLSVSLPSGARRGAAVESKIENAISTLCDSNCHAIAWSFPKQFRNESVLGVFLLASNVSID